VVNGVEDDGNDVVVVAAAAENVSVDIDVVIDVVGSATDDEAALTAPSLVASRLDVVLEGDTDVALDVVVVAGCDGFCDVISIILVDWSPYKTVVNIGVLNVHLEIVLTKQ